MSGRFSKRGKNPGAVDCWLDSLGYYRKNVAYDETCMFRAISEQLYTTQINHEEVRKKCITYGKHNSKEFQHLIPRKKDWFDRLKKLAVHMVVCTEIEIQLICNTYQVDVKVFNAVSHDTKEFRGHKLYKGTETLLLCKMGEDHYDAVYTKEHIAIAGFCQSIVYNVLYEKVFEVPDVESVVHSMLHDKQAPYAMYCPDITAIKKEELDSEEIEDYDGLMLDAQNRQQNMLAPFPFKIAKALDPHMYRNIEYDTWLELRREMRLGDWYYGDDKLILGTRCIITLGNEDFQCYIQEILENDKNRCEVYVTRLAERLTVNYTDLRPEDGAKPWPLPYRFARNQPLAITNGTGCNDNDRRSLRKRREKKRHSLSEENVKTELQQEIINDMTVSNYEGCPLLMQDTTDMISLERLSAVVQVSNCSPEPIGIDEENEGIGILPEPMSWSQSSGTPREVYQNTVTQPSESVTFQNASAQMVYTYASETSYPAIPVWAAQPSYVNVLSPDSALSEEDISSPVDYSGNPQKYVYYQADSAYGSPTYVPAPSIPPSPLSFPPFSASFNDRVVCPTPASPATPQVDMYPILYPVPSPGTPVYYTHPPGAAPTQTSRPQEYMIPAPSPLPLYSPPPVEMQYVPTPTYMYPSTPPVAWYNSPHVNSQGFIFPPPLNNNSNGVQNQNVPNYV